MQTVRCATHPDNYAMLFCNTCKSHQTACPTCIIENGTHHNHSFTSLENGLKAVVQHHTKLVDKVQRKQRNATEYQRRLKQFDERLLNSVTQCVTNLDETIDKLIDDLQQVRVALHTATLRAAQTARYKANGDVDFVEVVKAVRKSTKWINECRLALTNASLSSLSDLVEQSPLLVQTAAELKNNLQEQNMALKEVTIDLNVDRSFSSKLGELSDQTSELRKLSDDLVLRKPAVPKKVNLLIAAGGYKNNCTFVYNPMTDSWRKAAPLTELRNGAAAALWNGKVVIAGGWNSTKKFMVSVEQYDPATNTWTTLPQMLHSREYFALQCYENTLFAIGGRTGGTVLDSVESYNGKSKQWEYAAFLHNHRAYICGAALKAGILVAGGNDNSSFARKTCEFYDGAARSWKHVASLVNARRTAAAAVLNEKVYVFAGQSEEGKNLDSAEEYDSVADKWTLLPVRLSTPRSYLAAATVNGQIYVCGGCATDNCDHVERFEADEKRFTSVAPIPQALSGAVAISVSVSADWFEQLIVEKNN